MFLEDVKDNFEIQNSVNRSGKEIVDDNTGEVIVKKRYQLYLGTDLFNQMLLSYENSLERKRPKNYKKN